MLKIPRATIWVVLAAGLLLVGCSKTHTEIPTDLLGLTVGMPKADAVVHLETIAIFETEAKKKQQVWQLKEPKTFNKVAVGFDGNDQVRFITAFVDPESTVERMRFADIGDLDRARADITPPHHRYTWDVDPKGTAPAAVVTAYGDDPEFVTMYSLANKIQSAKIKEYPQ